MPAISVVVPVYNPGSFIDECADSLLDQLLRADRYSGSGPTGQRASPPGR